MDIIEVKTLEDFSARLKFLEETDLFRGLNDIDYQLIPSIGRFNFIKKESLYQFEKSILSDFKRKSYLYIDQEPKNEFEWLFLAQHHGLPTRLLDWTYSPLVALFFAVETDKNTDCCVYQRFHSTIVTPDIDNTWKHPFDVPDGFEIIPNLKHIRYQNQNGLFTTYTNPQQESLEKITAKFIIRKENKGYLRWKLRKMGITKNVLFPSLDSLSYDIVEMTEIKYEHLLNKK